MACATAEVIAPVYCFDLRKRHLTKRGLWTCWLESGWTRKLGAVRLSLSWTNVPEYSV